MRHNYSEKFTITTSSLWVFVTYTVAGAQIVMYIRKYEYPFIRENRRESRERIWKINEGVVVWSFYITREEVFLKQYEDDTNMVVFKVLKWR